MVSGIPDNGYYPVSGRKKTGIRYPVSGGVKSDNKVFKKDRFLASN